MKLHCLSRGSRSVRWPQPGVDHLRQALRYLQRLLAVDPPLLALARVPARAVPPHGTRHRHRSSWHD